MKLAKQDKENHQRIKKENRKINWCIYNNKTAKEFVDKHHWLHYFVKYKIFVPLLYIFEKSIGKRLDKEVPEEIYNKNIKVFNDSFEDALVIWCEQFCRNSGKQHHSQPDQDTRENIRNKWASNSSSRLLRDAKDTALTLALNDTAYREFINIWMFEVTKQMNALYKDQDKIIHPLYTSKAIDDVTYVVIWKLIEDGKLSLEVVDAKK